MPTATTPTAAEVAAIGPGTDLATDLTAVDTIPVLRGQIDALDDAIRRLVSERAKLSQRVQAARVNSGGTRVELGRERLIMDAYRQALGPNGPALADAVLQVCRGAR